MRMQIILLVIPGRAFHTSVIRARQPFAKLGLISQHLRVDEKVHS